MDFLGFVACAQLASDRLSAEADGELLADLAIVIGDDVVGVGVEADQAGDLDMDAGFFFDLADDGLGQGLAYVLAAAGDGVLVVVGAADHQEAAGGVLDDGAHGHPDAVGLRGVRVVEVVGPAHGSTLSEGGALRAGPNGLQASGVGLEEVACGESA